MKKNLLAAFAPVKTGSSHNNTPLYFPSRAWLLFVLTGTILLHEGHCGGQGTLYTSRAAFNAALSSSAIATFESLQPSDPNSTGVSPISDSGLTFSSAGFRLFITSPITGLYPIQGTGQYLWNFDSSVPVSVFLPVGRNAFGADFSGGIVPQNNPFTGTLTFSLADGQIYTHQFTGQVGSWTFLGFTFPQEIRSLVFDDNGGLFHEEMFDNVTFGVAVPEPNALALGGLCAALLLIFWRRK
jgi:PEP-CTERM motif